MPHPDACPKSTYEDSWNSQEANGIIANVRLTFSQLFLLGNAAFYKMYGALLFFFVTCVMFRKEFSLSILLSGMV